MIVKDANKNTVLVLDDDAARDLHDFLLMSCEYFTIGSDPQKKSVMFSCVRGMSFPFPVGRLYVLKDWTIQYNVSP